MRNVILALILLALPASAFAAAKKASDVDLETKAESYVPRAKLNEVDADAQAIVDARKPGKSAPAEIVATAGYEKAATAAFYAAGKARTALNVDEFDKQAKAAKDARGKACAILSGC